MGPSNIVVDSWSQNSWELGHGSHWPRKNYFTCLGSHINILLLIISPKVGREMNIEVVKVEQHVIQLECSWNKLLIRLAGGELVPRLSLVSPKVFSPFCHRWSFRSLPLSPLACSVGDTSFPAQSST